MSSEPAYSRLPAKQTPILSERVSEIMNYPAGWHKDRGRDGAVVWAEGREYTEDGTAPGRVQVIACYRHCGPFRTWAWIRDLQQTASKCAATFVEFAREYNEGCAKRLEAEAEKLRANTRRWEARVTEGKPDDR